MALGERLQEMIRLEAFPVVDAASGAAGGKDVGEKERVRVAHRHDQKAGIVSTKAPVRLQEIRLKDQTATIADDALGLARRS